MRDMAVDLLMGALKTRTAQGCLWDRHVFHWISETATVACTDLNRQFCVRRKQNTTYTIKVS